LTELIWIDLADGASTAWWWAWADRTRLPAWVGWIATWVGWIATWVGWIATWVGWIATWVGWIATWVGWIAWVGWILSACGGWGWICVAWFVVRLRRLRRKGRGSWRERERKKE
jgi:hypothetical protein